MRHRSIQTSMSPTECVELINEMLDHAYKKGAFNDRDPVDVVDMVAAVGNLSVMAHAYEPQPQSTSVKPCTDCDDKNKETNRE